MAQTARLFGNKQIGKLRRTERCLKKKLHAARKEP